MAARGDPPLTDSQLREELISYGYTPGPITGTTRSLLLKKLDKLRSEKKKITAKAASRKVSSPKVFALSSDESEGEAVGNSRVTAPVSSTRRRSGARVARPAPKTKRNSVGVKNSQTARKTSSRRSLGVGINYHEVEDDINDDGSEKSDRGRGHEYQHPNERDFRGGQSTNDVSNSRTVKGRRRSIRQGRGAGDSNTNRVNGEQLGDSTVTSSTASSRRGEFSDSDEELFDKGVKTRTKKQPTVARTSEPYKFSKVKTKPGVIVHDEEGDDDDNENVEEDEDDSASDNSGQRNTFVVNSSKDGSRKEDSRRGRWNFLSGSYKSKTDSPPRITSNTSRSKDTDTSSNWTFFTSPFNSSRTSTPRKASSSRDDTTYHSINPGNSFQPDAPASAAATPVSGRPTLRGSTLDASSSNHTSFHGQTPTPMSSGFRQDYSTPAPNENRFQTNAQTPLREQSLDEAQIFATEENLGSSWRTQYSHFVSKVLLGSVCLFFIMLGLMYLSVNSTVKSRYLQIADITGGDDVDFSGDELPLLMGQALHEKLSEIRGDFLCGKSPVKNMTMDEAKIYLEEYPSIQKRTPRSNPFWVSEYMPRTLFLITSNPQWSIRLFDTKKEHLTEYKYDNDVKWLESSHVYMNLFCQVKTTAIKLLFWATILVISLLVLWPGFYLIKYQMQRKEQARQEVTQLVEKIIEVLANHQQACYQDKSLTPYLAIPHVRDTLIPPAERHKKQHLWQKAVQFLNVNESRVRVETQQVAGEEFAVWRWVQPSPAVAVTSFVPITDRDMNPKRAKVWQGTAFASLDSAVKASAYNYTPCLKVRNMFDPTLESGINWHLTIQDAILERCGDDSGIMHIAVEKTSREGCVYVKCVSAEKAGIAFRCLQGSWFDGKLVTVKYIRLDRYHQRFPSALNVTSLLKPSNNLRMSLQSPPSTPS
ncbi:inner nuclear membrane protein Man1-like [Lytechinus pictus]|uniref:inner nuclear membrane protein Man1-like n=1 Tax=Lytechinus pictus TaxID=7653 RepID=UPI0030B9EBCE